MFQPSSRYPGIIERIDTANAADPVQETDPVSCRPLPGELLYSQRMSDMLTRFAPDASEAVHIAVRAQHIRRWEIPRTDYPQTTFGYKQWRARLSRFHAETASELMREAGYDEEMASRVRTIVGKLGIKVNPESQLLEDVASLVFLEHYLSGFIARHPDYTREKFHGILQKTWLKMSPAGRAFALSKIKAPLDLASFNLTTETHPLSHTPE